MTPLLYQRRQGQWSFGLELQLDLLAWIGYQNTVPSGPSSAPSVGSGAQG